MNPLIPISQLQVGREHVATINARELHAFLEVGKVFAAWIQERIQQYGFLENQDFVCFPVSESNGRGGHNRKDYHLTLDMAKELAMVERNDKGKQARQYFIDCERRAKAVQPEPMQLLADPTALRQALLTYSERVMHLEAANADMQPKVAAFSRIAEAEGSLCITSAAKHLQLQPKALFAWLSEHRWIYRRAGGTAWLAYQDKLQAGLLEHKITTVARGDGSEKVVEQVRVTSKGLARLAEQYQDRLA